MGQYTGTPASSVSVFKLGRVVALFLWLMQYPVANSVAIIVVFDTTNFPAFPRRPASGRNVAQRSCNDICREDFANLSHVSRLNATRTIAEY